MQFELCVRVFFLVAVIQIVRAEYDPEWEEFKILYRKRYSNASEEAYRHTIWRDNVRYVATHNGAAATGKFPYTLKQTQLSDHPEEELVSYLTHGNPNRHRSYDSVCERSNRQSIPPFDPREDPDEVDYRTSNCLPNVKDQRQLQCGSCWAFGVTSTVEFMNCHQRKTYTRLSEQQLVDCSRPYGNKGCDGGFSNATLDYIVDYGLQSEESYPYVAMDQPCRFDPLHVAAAVKSYTIWPCEEELYMKHLIATHGPITAVIYAKGDFFWLADGVLDYVDCPPLDQNHVVSIVGYGTSPEGIDYWLIRNSYGPFWGVHGYGKVRRGVNFCSIATMPVTVQMD